MSPGPNLDRVAGCVLGAAIGDALGHPVEFLGSLEAIRKTFGPEGVTGFVLFWEHGGGRYAPYTDDTQMAEIVLRCLLAGWEAAEGLEATMERMGVDSPPGPMLLWVATGLLGTPASAGHGSSRAAAPGTAGTRRRAAVAR